jgi:hypothetical protein
MSGAEKNDDFDRRLAGQPADPSVDTRQLLASTEGAERTDASMVFGDMRITETTEAGRRPRRHGLLPWFAAIVVGLVLAGLVLVVVLAWNRAADAQMALQDARQRLAAAKEELATARSQVDGLTRERDALAVESERRALELAELRRSMEEADAKAKRLAAEAAKPAARSGHRRKRRRR